MRHSTHAQKGDDLRALLEDTNSRAAALHTRRPAAPAPAPLFHQDEPRSKETAPPPVSLKPGAKKLATAKPAASRRKTSDDESDDESDGDYDSSDSEDEPAYEALAILNQRTYRRRIQYLVQWANGPKGESYQPSWEPKENVGLPLIDAYEAKPIAPPPKAKPNAEKRKHASVDVELAKNPAAVNLAATREKRQCAALAAPAAGPDTAPPAAPPAAPPTAAPPPAAPPARVAMTLNRQGVDLCVRYGTITAWATGEHRVR